MEKPDKRSIASDPRLFIETLGYDIDTDSDQPGLWIWTAPSDGCDSSFHTAKEALDSVWNDAVAQTLSISGISREDWGRMEFDAQRVAMTLALTGELPALSDLSPDTQMEWMEKVREVYPEIGPKEAFRLADQDFIANEGVLKKKFVAAYSKVSAGSERSYPPLKTDLVFTDAPEPVGMLWRNLSALENELASKLYGIENGIVLMGTDAWLLRERDGEMWLYYATLKDGRLCEEETRFDIALDWVDIDSQIIEDYNQLVECVLGDFDQLVTTTEKLGLSREDIFEVESVDMDSKVLPRGPRP